jgi:glutamate dehydrogenase
MSQEEFFAQPVDILIPAALENAIHEGNAERVRARVVLEVANGPVTPEADRILEAKDVLVVPDILTNAGGVAVSYFEQVQNAMSYAWSEEEVNRKLERLMTDAFREVWERKERYNTSMRMGAYAVAIERVVAAMRARGWVR